MTQSKKIMGFIGIALANFMAMFLISGIGVIGYDVADEYNAVLSVSMIFTPECITRCIAILLSGRLGEKFGRKNLFLFAMSVYTVSYIAATFIPNFNVFVIARTISGFGWGLWITNSFVLMNDVFGNREATKYTGYAQSASTVAMLAAPPMAGIFCSTIIGWRLQYYLCLPFMAISIILCATGIPKVERTCDNQTAFPIHLLRNRLYFSVFMISLMFSMAVTVFTYLPSYIQHYYDVDALRAGLVTTPSLILASILTAVFGNYAARTMKYRPLILLWGIGSIAGGILLFMTGMPFMAKMPFFYSIISILPLGALNSCQQIIPYTYPLNVLKPGEIATGMSFMGLAGVFGNTIANGMISIIINASGIINCFKIPLFCSIVIMIFSLTFRDIQKGETL